MLKTIVELQAYKDLSKSKNYENFFQKNLNEVRTTLDLDLIRSDEEKSLFKGGSFLILTSYKPFQTLLRNSFCMAIFFLL